MLIESSLAGKPRCQFCWQPLVIKVFAAADAGVLGKASFRERGLGSPCGRIFAFCVYSSFIQRGHDGRDT